MSAINVHLRAIIICMTIIMLLIIATLAYTAFGLLLAQAGGKIDVNFSAFLYNGIGAAIPLAIYLFFKGKDAIENTGEGVLYSILAGAAIATFAIVLNIIFSRAENASFVIPVIYGGTIVLASLGGLALFKETISTTAIAGLLLITVGVSLVVYARITA